MSHSGNPYDNKVGHLHILQLQHGSLLYMNIHLVTSLFKLGATAESLICISMNISPRLNETMPQENGEYLLQRNICIFT